MKKGLDIALFVSTGRCGTTFLANSMHSPKTFVCHELEFPDAPSVLKDYYMPAAISGNINDAIAVMEYYKIPQIRNTLSITDCQRYVDTGHQYNYGMLPAILSLDHNVKLVRLRRDRYETALSFMTTDPIYDIWSTENYAGYFRWMMSPHHKICQNQDAILRIWPRLSRLQKVIWAIDEVERLWMNLLSQFEFPYIEYSFESIKNNEFDNLCTFLNVEVDPTNDAKATNSSKFWKRKKPEITRSHFEEEDLKLRELYDKQIRVKD